MYTQYTRVHGCGERRISRRVGCEALVISIGVFPEKPLISRYDVLFNVGVS